MTSPFPLKVKFGPFLPPFPYIKGPKTARSGQLRRVISQQPSRVERQMSPFWKLEKQGYKIMWKPGKSKIWPWTPPPIPLRGYIYFTTLIFAHHQFSLTLIFAPMISAHLPLFFARLGDRKLSTSKGASPNSFCNPYFNKSVCYRRTLEMNFHR